MILELSFFDRTPLQLAPALLGKVLRHLLVDADTGQKHWLAAQIIETEAYYRREKGSHASLGFTAGRKALFMPPATIYMYYARGGDSLNFSARGRGDAVLIKSGYPFFDQLSPRSNLPIMQRLNPASRGQAPRNPDRLCSGQTLLCKSIDLKVKDWDQRAPDPVAFYVDDIGYSPDTIVRCQRLGIPAGRDEHLLYRFVDAQYHRSATRDPLARRGQVSGKDYRLLKPNHRNNRDAMRQKRTTPMT